MYHMKEEFVYVGVDMAKRYLDAAMGNEKRRFSNDAVGHRELIQWVKQLSAPVQVICDSSGGYERALVQALARGRVKISLVPANRVRQFARAAGILAKTDRIDAEVLCDTRSRGYEGSSPIDRAGTWCPGSHPSTG
jgi:Transposase.